MLSRVTCINYLYLNERATKPAHDTTEFCDLIYVDCYCNIIQLITNFSLLSLIFVFILFNIANCNID